MELLLVRHAPAEDREAWAKTKRPDDVRPLTEEGRRKMKKAARGLSEVAPKLDAILTSPFLRAAQSANILASSYKRAKTSPLDALKPDGSFDDLVAALKRHKPDAALALVGHSPHLVNLAAWLTGGESFALELKKGGACLIRFKGAAKAGGGKLSWLLQPAQLRKLA